MPRTPKPHGRAPSRRAVLRAAGLAIASGALLTSRRTARAAPQLRRVVKPRPDLVDPSMQGEIEIIQLTDEPDVPSCHVYMEAQVFTPDSRRLVLHRSAHPHGSDRTDPKHQYILCDLEDGGALHPLTHEIGTTGPSVSPDGKYLYYFVDETAGGTGPLMLRRVNLDGTGRETLHVIDTYLPGTRFRPSKVYSLSTISSDGRKIAISACLDNTRTPWEYGLLIYDLQQGTVEIVLHGPDWANVHPQFSRSTQPEARRDLLVQQNHGHRMGVDGTIQPTDDRRGLDLHVVRDDGTNMRDLPWGRDGREFCEGHQCWRGRSDWAITSVGVSEGAMLIEGFPAPHAGHVGIATPDGRRNVLSREFDKPRFHHFAVDLAGRQLITDYEKTRDASRIYLARLGEPGVDPLRDFRCLARPRPSGVKQSHTHPFLSPDGRLAFFNTDETGMLQAYMIRGLG